MKPSKMIYVLGAGAWVLLLAESGYAHKTDCSHSHVKKSSCSTSYCRISSTCKDGQCMEQNIKPADCKKKGFHCTCVSSDTVLALAVDGFEGTPDGVDLNGQGGFYNPDRFLAVSAKVYTYGDNALELPPNPAGGGKFIGARGPGNRKTARSARPFAFGEGRGAWTLSFDVAVAFTGSPPSAQGPGGFSVVTSDGAAVIALAQWVNPSNPQAGWNAEHLWYTANGEEVLETIPDGAFNKLAPGHWYRWGMTVDLDTNRVLNVSITDLSTESTATYRPEDRYMIGGAEGGPAPEAVEVFAGNFFRPGNTFAIDNVLVVETTGECTGREQMTINCTRRGDIKMTFKNATPEAFVILQRSGGVPRYVEIKGRKGKAKTKWVELEAGLHTIAATLPCGEMMFKAVECGR